MQLDKKGFITFGKNNILELPHLHEFKVGRDKFIQLEIRRRGLHQRHSRCSRLLLISYIYGRLAWEEVLLHFCWKFESLVLIECLVNLACNRDKIQIKYALSERTLSGHNMCTLT